MADSIWTPERMAALETMWREGLSVSEIGRRIIVNGKPIGRNAVVGKVHRMKLPPRPSPIGDATDRVPSWNKGKRYARA